MDSSIMPPARPSDAHETGEEPAFFLHYNGEELLPRVVREHVLLMHVTDMQLTYPKRLQWWQKEREKMREDEDLVKLGFGTRDGFRMRAVKIKRPRVVELSRMWVRPMRDISIPDWSDLQAVVQEA